MKKQEKNCGGFALKVSRMNDIDKMPPKCQSCPYWELCEYPYVCGDMRGEQE